MPTPLDFIAETAVVKVHLDDGSGHRLVVRGLGLAHIIQLVIRHGPYLAAKYQELASGGPNGVAARDMILGLLTEAEELANEIVAMSIGDPSAIDVAAALPFPTKVQVLYKAVEFTLAENGGLGKLMGALVDGMAAVNQEADLLRQSPQP